jgi:hypothetical protein
MKSEYYLPKMSFLSRHRIGSRTPEDTQIQIQNGKESANNISISYSF